jgi:tetratricopeptide (TPR) repeat protein
VRLLGIEGLRARLDERFHILTGGTRSVLRRHQTLRAALEWSHGLLSPDERTVFRRLGVFVGGFTLELAQDVAADDQIDRWTLLDVLGHLVDKSLVVADGEELPRYRMLETVRAFALEQLAASGETPTLLRRHAEALLAILAPVNDRRFALTLVESVRHGAELDNLRAALAWAESEADNRALAFELIGSSRCIWFSLNLLNEGIERALRLLPLPDGLPLDIEARFNLLLGSLGYLGARRECFVAALRAAELYRSSGNTAHQIDALVSAAQFGPRLGETKRCADAIAEAETLIGPHTPPRQAASLALAKAQYHVSLDQLEQALESALRQAALYGESGDAWGEYLGLCNAAFYECGLGRFDSAIARLRTALEALRQINAPHGEGQALGFLACARALRGDRDEALSNAQAAIPHLQFTQNVSWLLQYIALVHSRHGTEDRAASLVGYVDRDFARAGRILYPMQTRIRDETLARAQAALGPGEVDLRTASGAKLTEEQAIALAFASR